jgi:hypothetical protein
MRDGRGARTTIVVRAPRRAWRPLRGDGLQVALDVRAERLQPGEEELLGAGVRDHALGRDEALGGLDVRLGLRELRRREVRQDAAEVLLRDGRADRADGRADDRAGLALERVLAVGIERLYSGVAIMIASASAMAALKSTATRG